MDDKYVYAGTFAFTTMLITGLALFNADQELAGDRISGNISVSDTQLYSSHSTEDFTDNMMSGGGVRTVFRRLTALSMLMLRPLS